MLFVFDPNPNPNPNSNPNPNPNPNQVLLVLLRNLASPSGADPGSIVLSSVVLY